MGTAATPFDSFQIVKRGTVTVAGGTLTSVQVAQQFTTQVAHGLGYTPAYEVYSTSGTFQAKWPYLGGQLPFKGADPAGNYNEPMVSGTSWLYATADSTYIYFVNFAVNPSYGSGSFTINPITAKYYLLQETAL